MSTKQEPKPKVEKLSQIVVSVHNTLVTLLDYIDDSIEVEEDDEDETCCDCGKPVY